MNNLLFVYGTLRRGFERHDLLRRRGARYVGKGKVQGELYDLGRYPGARGSGKPSARLAGEVYRLANPTRAFKVLDAVEGYRSAAPEASLFRRETTLVTLESGDQESAWIYWLNRPPSRTRPLRSGDYAKG